jgi:hypothetical protein
MDAYIYLPGLTYFNRYSFEYEENIIKTLSEFIYIYQ